MINNKLQLWMEYFETMALKSNRMLRRWIRNEIYGNYPKNTKRRLMKSTRRMIHIDRQENKLQNRSTH